MIFLLAKYLISSSPPGISGATVTIAIKSSAAEITSSISDKLPALNCVTTCAPGLCSEINGPSV